MNSSTFINSRIGDCRIIELERIAHDNGTIAVAQNSDRLPFAMKRAFYLYDIPSGSSRGGHAHITDHQLIVAVSGAFTVNLTDGHEDSSFFLSQPNEGLYVPPGIWLNLERFSSGSVCLTLSSGNYQEDDYLREYDRFINLKKKK